MLPQAPRNYCISSIIFIVIRQSPIFQINLEKIPILYAGTHIYGILVESFTFVTTQNNMGCYKAQQSAVFYCHWTKAKFHNNFYSLFLHITWRIIPHDPHIGLGSVYSIHLLHSVIFTEKKIQQEGDGSHTLTSNSRNKKRHQRCLRKGYSSHGTNKKNPGWQVGPACGSSIHIAQLKYVTDE
jgi:hypothetical protein